MIETREEVLTRNALRLEIDDIKNDLRMLRRDMAELTQTLIQAGKTEAGAAKAKIQDETSHRLDQLREAIDRVRKTTERTFTQAKATVEDHPFLVAASAMAAGLVIGSLVRNDRRSQKCGISQQS